jgi:hypothetical protein
VDQGPFGDSISVQHSQRNINGQHGMDAAAAAVVDVEGEGKQS